VAPPFVLGSDGTKSKLLALSSGCPTSRHTRPSAFCGVMISDLSECHSRPTAWAKKVGPQTHDHNSVKS